MSKATKNQQGYTAVEALLIFVALAIVGFVAWYVHHATVAANTSYSIQETSQKPAVPKKGVAPKASTSTSTTQPSTSH